MSENKYPDIRNHVERVIQRFLDMHGWDTPKETLDKQIYNLPEVKDKRMKESIEKAFDEAEKQNPPADLIVTEFTDERLVSLDMDIKGIIPEGDPRIVMTENTNDFPLLFTQVTNELTFRDYVPWYKAMDRRREIEKWEARMIEHENQHMKAYKGKIINPDTGELINNETDIKFGIQISYGVSRGWIISPFIAFNGVIKLQDLIEATAAPTDLSEGDKQKLVRFESILKKAQIMKEDESIFNPYDRQQAYKRNKQ